MSSTAKAANKLIALSIEASQSIKSMVIKLKVRTIPRDNFDLVGTDFEMVNHTISKVFDQPSKWRIDKSERVVVCDGSNCFLWVPGSEIAVKAGPNAGFVTWLKTLLDPQAILSKEQNIAKERKSKVTMKQSGNDILMTVTSSARGNFMNDYTKNKSIEESDNRREYVFDNNTKLLKGLKIYIIQGKKETLILETEKIDYDVPVDPSLFAINLPQGITWKEATNNYTSERFRNISSKRAAELFFQGMANNDWKLVGETCDFFNGNSKRVQEAKEDFGGLTVIHIGEPFKSGLFPGEFVPYEIKFKSGQVKKFNLALKNNNPNKVWIVSGGF
jgi:outer membrane lipoprotein-sorting protein